MHAPPNPERVTVCLSTSAYPPEVGGVAVASRRLATLLAAEGYRVHVVTPVEVEGARGETTTTREGDVTVHRLLCDWRDPDTPFHYRSVMRRLDEEHAFDLFHAFFLSALPPCTSAAARGRPGRPVIASIRGSDVTHLLAIPALRSQILPGLRKAGWITSVNELYLERIAREVPIAGRSSVIRNGVRRPEGQALWQLCEGNRGVVGSVGQFRKVKDIPLLVRAYGCVDPVLRRRLLLAGYFGAADAAEEQWTQTLIDELGLRAGTTITGPFAHAAVHDHLRAMHVYVQASAFEGLPNAVLEAAALGVPLVATAVGGLAEILEDGRSALLVPHGDPRQLGAAIARVLADDALALHLSQGALELASRLTVQAEQEQWLALYRRLLAEAPATGAPRQPPEPDRGEPPAP